MEGIHLACTRVQYRSAVNCELFKTLTVGKTENFLIRRMLKTSLTYSHTSCSALNNMESIQDPI